GGVVVDGLHLAGSIQVAAELVESAAQAAAVTEAAERHSFLQFQVAELLSLGLERRVGRAQVERHFRGGGIVVGRKPQADVNRQERTRVPQLADDGAKRGADRRRKERRLRRGGKSGVDLMHLVVGLRERQVADEGQLVGDFRLERHVLADVESQDVRWYRIEL